MSNNNLLRIVTLFDASEEAEILINALRNAGHIVRDIRAEDDEDLKNAIDEHPLDLVLGRPKLALLNARQALNIIAASGRDLPMVIITDPGQENSAIDLLNAGARDIIGNDQPVRLQHIVSREIADLQTRRALRQSEKMLHETEKRARNLIDNSRDAISYVHDGMHLYANQAYLKMFGYDDLDDILGMPILDMVDTKEHAAFKDFLRTYIRGDSEDSSFKLSGRHSEGRTFKITMEFTPASMEGETCIQIIIRDQSLSKELEKKLSVLSRQDLLTGTYNRSYFMEQVDKLISRAVDGKARGALLYIDLDDYQDIKEKIGMSGTDLYLVEVAGVLKAQLSAQALLARYEGAVFTLLLEGADTTQAQASATTIYTAIADHLADVAGQTVRSTASIGISLFNETTSSGQRCLLNAEKACDDARQSGGNRAMVYNPRISELAEKEKVLHWSQTIKYALQHNQFQLLYQPIISLHGEPGENYETLLHMYQEDGTEVSPAEFMPAAEETGLMLYVDRWVMANALTRLAERHQNGTRTRLFIKLSGGSISDPRLLEWVGERFKALKLDADYVVFEIDEQTALNRLKQAQQLIDGLSRFHCRIALDHFGNESDTFDAIKHLRVNYLKLDGSLANNLANNLGAQEKIKIISDHASNIGVQTIASCVEDANSLAVLWQCSLDFIQGHFLQPPGIELDYDFNEEGSA